MSERATTDLVARALAAGVELHVLDGRLAITSREWGASPELLGEIARRGPEIVAHLTGAERAPPPSSACDPSLLPSPNPEPDSTPC